MRKNRVIERPEDYRWCSFAAAVHGDRKARAGYAFMYGKKRVRPFYIINILSSANAPVPKIDSEKLWLDKGVSKNTTELSRAISQGERLARRLPLGSPIRSKIVQSLGDLRRFMRNPTLVKAGAAGSVLTVFEGFYDIGTMLYCSIHCCGR